MGALVRYLVGCLVIVSGLFALGSVAVAQQSAGGTVSGQIVDAITLRPVQGGRVTLTGRAGAPLNADADGNGRFSFAAVPEGQYDASVSAEGYVTATQSRVQSVRGRVTEIEFTLTKIFAGFGEVIVTAKARSVDPFAGASARSLSREEIRRNPGTAGDVFRGLDTLPGVAATGEFSNFTVRSRNPRDNLILIDNIPFDKVVHFDRSIGEEELISGGGRFSVFAPNLIGNAEFQPGGWSAAYGGKNASLLKLDLVEANRQTPSFNLRADVAGGEFTYEGPSGIADNTSVLFSARYFDFETLFNVIGENDIGSPSLTDIIFKSSTKINANNKLNIVALYTPEWFTRDVANVAESPNFDDATLLDAEQDSALLGATWERLFGATGRLTNTLYVRYSDKTSIEGEAFPDLAPPNADPDTIPVRENILTLTEREREIGWRGDFSISTGIGVLSAGARVMNIDLDFSRAVAGNFVRYVYDQDDFRPNPMQQFIVLTPQRYNSAFDESATNFAAYVDHAFTWGDFTFRPGVRFDRDGFSDQSLVSPRFSAGWQVTPETLVTLTGGIFYQSPRFLDLAANPGNNNLKNEKSTQVSLGITQSLTPDLTAFGEVYYTKLDDLVVLTDATTGLATNTGEGYAAGIDLALNKRFSDDWEGSITYSYSHAERDDNLGEGTYDADYDRPHVFGLSFSWNITNAWSIGAKWKYLSGRPTDSFIVNSNVMAEPGLFRFSKQIVGNNDLRVRDYHTLNLRVDYRRRIGGVNLIAFLDVINAYGRTNIDRLEFNERRGTNQDTGLEVFPQIGLRLEF